MMSHKSGTSSTVGISCYSPTFQLCYFARSFTTGTTFSSCILLVDRYSCRPSLFQTNPLKQSHMQLKNYSPLQNISVQSHQLTSKPSMQMLAPNSLLNNSEKHAYHQIWIIACRFKSTMTESYDRKDMAINPHHRLDKC